MVNDIDFEIDGDFPIEMSAEVKKLNGRIANRLSRAYNEVLQKEMKNYKSGLARTKKSLYRGRTKTNKWASFYKRLSNALFAEDIQPISISEPFLTASERTIFDVKTGFNNYITATTKSGGGGANLPELYYYGKGKGDPQKKTVFGQSTKGNPPKTRFLRGVFRTTRRTELQDGRTAGTYRLEEGYESQSWDNQKEKFDKYGEKIREGFNKASKRVFSEMNR